MNEYQYYMLTACEPGGVKQLHRAEPDEVLPANCSTCGVKLEYHASRSLRWAVHAPVAA